MLDVGSRRGAKRSFLHVQGVVLLLLLLLLVLMGLVPATRLFTSSLVTCDTGLRQDTGERATLHGTPWTTTLKLYT